MCDFESKAEKPVRKMSKVVRKAQSMGFVYQAFNYSNDKELLADIRDFYEELGLKFKG